MTGCEEELCPFWAGDGGCPCLTLQISEHERRREQRALGIAVPWADPDDEYGDDEEDERMKDHGERTAVVVTANDDGSVSIGHMTGHLYGPDGSESIWRDQGKKPER